MTGTGLLVQPDPEHDLEPPDGLLGERVWLAGLGQYGWEPALSLHWADWTRAMRHLYDIGWSPMEDEEGELDLVGTTTDGRNAIALYGEHPIITEPSLDQIDHAIRDLCQSAGVELSDGNATAKE
ncbi:hypothetical protein [Kribbella deserti]|uniref:Uncharacterized protein n=1 Tax=Kribbella deserti TaxID=1926257 RepID=A0ABV6QFD5_9ACTN